METQALKVYWRPGCSSCVRIKEFLSELGIEYQSINVSAVPQAMEELREVGVRTGPLVARGKEYVFPPELADVSPFIRREGALPPPPPPPPIGKRAPPPATPPPPPLP